jgi:hypothetical protein
VILSRDEREGVVGAGGGETEGEESSSRSDCWDKKGVGYQQLQVMDSCSAHLMHRVAIAVVGGFLILFFLLRFVHFFAFFLPLVTIVALLALVTILVFLLNVHLYLYLTFLIFLFWFYFWLLFGIGSDRKCLGLALWVHRDIGMDDMPRHWTRLAHDRLGNLWR